MRYLITAGHTELHTQWREAYARHDAFAEAGDDGVKFGGSAKADEASAAEYAALDAFLLSPSVTTVELQEKIAVMRSRGPLAPDCLIWNEHGMSAILDRLERDLVEMARPNASPPIAAAFADWAEKHRAHCQDNVGNDDADDALCNAASEAFRAVMDTPCTTPGDFIVKRYLEALGEAGPVSKGGQAVLPFLIDAKHIGGNRLDDIAEAAQYRDIKATDIGCCMLALGRVDFDAARWIEVARTVSGKEVTLVQHKESARTLAMDFAGGDELPDLLLRLTANGLRMVSESRVAAIADEIEANHPDLVTSIRPTVDA